MLKIKDIPKYQSWGKYKIDVHWNDLEYTIDKYVCNDNLDSDPDFQRSHVWNISKQSAYVEHILKGGLSGRDIQLNHPGWQTDFEGTMVLVDGKQRLEAVRKFLRNNLLIFDEYRYADIEKNARGKLPRDYEFVFNINDLKTRREVLHWYLDLNSGGVIHTEYELNKVRELLSKEQ